jgi:hypothetical protein
MRQVRVFVLVAGALLSGCVNLVAERSYKLDPVRRSGLVVASFDQSDVMWSYRRVGADRGWAIEVMDSPMNQLIGVRGGLIYPFVLDEGNYEFYAWHARVPGPLYHRRSPPLSIRFHVTRGKATYIGNLSVIVHPDDFSFTRATEGYTLQIEDHRDVDIPGFLTKYPNVGEQDVMVSLMFSTEYYTDVVEPPAAAR